MPADAEAVAALRRDYRQASLSRDSLAADPLEQLATWQAQAKATGEDPLRATLARTDGAGRPDVGPAQLQISEGRAVLSANALLPAKVWLGVSLFWVGLERQVNIEGRLAADGAHLEIEEVEFWQGRPNRLHDRFRYYRQDTGDWRIERLSP